MFHLQSVILPPVDEDHILEIPQVPADHLGGHHLPLGMEAAELQQLAEPLVLCLHADQFHIGLAQLFIFLFQSRVFLFQGSLGGKIVSGTFDTSADPPTTKLMGRVRGW